MNRAGFLHGLREAPSVKAAMGGLNDAEIVAPARHFSAQPVTTPPGPVDADKRRPGAQVSRRALCGTCHLPGYPGRYTAMSAVLYGLGDADLANLAHYFATTK